MQSTANPNTDHMSRTELREWVRNLPTDVKEEILAGLPIAGIAERLNISQTTAAMVRTYVSWGVKA